MIYDKNETMQLLGKQRYGTLMKLCAEKAFRELRDAYKEEHLYQCDLAFDAYMLGYIRGKQEERAKRRRTGAA